MPIKTPVCGMSGIEKPIFLAGMGVAADGMMRDCEETFRRFNQLLG